MTLEISNLSVALGGKPVVQDVSLSVEPGKIIAILGANGAGKSELVSGIAGILPTVSGKASVNGVNITGKSPDVIRAASVAAVPEGHRVLTNLTVDENLRAAGAVRQSDIENNLASTYAMFPELAERKGQRAGSLSGGQQQMVAIGHALMSAPQFLIIDEMSLGLAPLIVKRLFGVIEALKADGVGIVLIEQFVDLALSVADHAIVLRNGRVAFSGPAQELIEDHDKLDQAYFGSKREGSAH